jgi:hypothetical protein
LTERKPRLFRDVGSNDNEEIVTIRTSIPHASHAAVRVPAPIVAA